MFIDNAHLDTRHRPAAFHPPLRIAQVSAVLGWVRQHAHGAGFSHTPALHHGHAPALSSRLDHRRRHRRTAADNAPKTAQVQRRLAVGAKQVAENGGHHRGERRAGRFDHPAQMRDLRMRSRHQHIGAGQPAAVGQPPGVGVEHGGQHQDRIALTDAEAVYRARGQRVQVRGLVAVDHTLGVARDAAGVADTGRRALVVLGPGVGVGLTGQRVAEVDKPRVGRERATGLHQEDFFNVRQLAEHRDQAFLQAAIDVGLTPVTGDGGVESGRTVAVGRTEQMAILAGIEQRGRILVGFFDLPRVLEFEVVIGGPQRVKAKRPVIVASHVPANLLVVVVAFALLTPGGR